jgi:hypothetical protein
MRLEGDPLEGRDGPTRVERAPTSSARAERGVRDRDESLQHSVGRRALQGVGDRARPGANRRGTGREVLAQRDRLVRRLLGRASLPRSAIFRAHHEARRRLSWRRRAPVRLARLPSLGESRGRSRRPGVDALLVQATVGGRGVGPRLSRAPRGADLADDDAVGRARRHGARRTWLRPQLLRVGQRPLVLLERSDPLRQLGPSPLLEMPPPVEAFWSWRSGTGWSRRARFFVHTLPVPPDLHFRPILDSPPRVSRPSRDLDPAIAPDSRSQSGTRDLGST